jgi:hypothetical protein
MELRERSFCIFLIALLACGGFLLSQQSSTNTSSGEHLPIGMWESKQPDGTVVGIDLSVVPASVPDAVYPEGTPRPLGSRLQIGVFLGHSQMAHHVENFFVTGWVGPGSENGFATYENRRLEVHNRDPRSDFETHIELVLDPTKDEWTGRFHRGSFDRQVTLERPSDQPGLVAPALLLTSTGTPALFRLEMRNPGNQDLVLNLGIELANGAKQYPDAVSYTLTTPDGRALHLESMEPGFIAGRVDPMIVPLPAGAMFSFLVDLNEYAAPKEKIWQLAFPPGRYSLQVEYTGRAVPESQANLDVRGIALMDYWVGTATAAPLVFTIEDGDSTPDR